MHNHEIVEEFYKGFYTALMSLPMDDGKSQHWNAGYDSGIEMRSERTLALFDYIDSINDTQQSVRSQGEDEVAYNIIIMNKMLEQLPPKIHILCINQLTILINSIINRSEGIKTMVSTQLQDVSLHLATLRFDLDVTKKERDALKLENTELRKKLNG